ncbi:MAG: hypothetical protein C0525_01490 [Flavobacterium sp.]|uniref:hypothetical protein n=1 Tax=Flavobacterium sp. TaxID=239 RepID=UPI0025C668F5|nr:hypothetical protein [Flavobacterium sp.]MBA4133374.1 hypothetical protein [Flavobacterium sp.]
MQATKEQKRLIAIHAPTKEIKEEWVQWATADVNKTSTNDLTFEQANMILKQLGQKPHASIHWAAFDKTNTKHRAIISMMYQAGWTITDDNGKEIPDLNRLNEWLHSSKCPVNKPLKEMDDQAEMPRLIKAFQGIVKSKWK